MMALFEPASLGMQGEAHTTEPFNPVIVLALFTIYRMHRLYLNKPEKKTNTRGRRILMLNFNGQCRQTVYLAKLL